MALDPHVKTYQSDVGTTITGATAIAMQSAWWLSLKNALVGFASNPWVVDYSCDGAVAGTPGDGVDRWVDAGDVVFAASAASAHSWVVLRNAVTGMEWLIEAVNNNATTGKTIRMAVSPAAGFTGGATTSSPTATDERVILTGATGHTIGLGISTSTTAAEVRLQVRHSTDGEVTIVVMNHANACTAFAYLGRPADPVTGWTSPLVAMWIASCGNATTPTPNPIDIDHAFWQGDGVSSTDEVGPHRAYLLNLPSAGAAGEECFLVGPACNNGDAVTTGSLTGETRASHTAGANAITGEHEAPSVGLRVCASPDRGTHGRLFDVRWAGDELSTGDTVPDDGSREWVKQGPFLIPWDGSVPLVA